MFYYKCQSLNILFQYICYGPIGIIYISTPPPKKKKEKKKKKKNIKKTKTSPGLEAIGLYCIYSANKSSTLTLEVSVRANVTGCRIYQLPEEGIKPRYIPLKFPYRYQKQMDNMIFKTQRLLLWIIYVIYVLCLSCFRVCSLLPCDHLLEKG